jgi:hypothetical protein
MIGRRSSDEGTRSPTSRAISVTRSVVPPMSPPRDDDDHSTQPGRPTIDLADRHSEDLDIVLMWAQKSGRLWVTVTHRRSGRSVRINATAANALDVFRHPFAYERDVVRCT